MSSRSPEPEANPTNGNDHRSDEEGRDVERKSKSRSRDASRRDTSRDRDERRRKRSRSRSRSRSRRDRSRSRSRDRYRDRRDRDRGDRYRDDRYRRDRDRGGRDRRVGDRRGGRDMGNKDDGLSAQDKELQKLERDTRTVFAFNLNLKAMEKELFQFFAAAGPIVDIKIIKDKTTNRSKGFAYVEYQNKESVIPALALTGQPLLGQTVMVKMSEAEKNLAWEAAEQQKKQAKIDAKFGAAPSAYTMAAGMVSHGAPGGAAMAALAGMNLAAVAAVPTGPVILLVYNVHPTLTDSDLRPMFEPFCSPGGGIDNVVVQRDPAGRSPSVAQVQFKLFADAQNAQTNLEGFDLVDMKLRITMMPAAPSDAAQQQANLVVGGLDERLDADATDGGGLRLTAQSRAALMSRLAATAGIEMPQMPAAYGGPAQVAAAPAVPDMVLDQGVLGPASPIPTQCLLLKNMFNPEEETEPDWDQEIAGDVREECSKYGTVEFLHVDRDSKGFVYVKFDSVPAASTAQKALHGRWFAAKQIVADYQFTSLFNSHFNLA